MHTATKKICRILVYHTGSLGDTIVATPALRVIRDNFPNAHVTLLFNIPFRQGLVMPEQIFSGAGLVDEYVSYASSSLLDVLPLIIKLRRQKFAMLAYLIRTYSGASRVWRDKIFFRMCGITQQLGIGGLTHAPKEFSHCEMSRVMHVADTLLSRLRFDGLITPDPGKGNMDLGIGEPELQLAAAWQRPLQGDGGRRWVGVGLGSKMPCKIWPYERYLAVLSNLINEYDLWPVVFGGPEDKISGDRLVRELGRGYVAAEALGVRASMAAMKKCAFFLGNDTGTMHMAAASGLRCVIPFSSRDIKERWYPYGDGHVVFRTQIPCQGCMLEECNDRRMECILAISVEDVLKGCNKVLSEIGLKRVKQSDNE